MDVFIAYAYGSAAWLSVQAAALAVSPKLIIALLAPEGHRTSDIEAYLSRSLAATLFTLAILLVILTGSIPLTEEALDGESAGAERVSKSPYAVPMVLVSTGLHATSAIYTYVRWNSTGQSVYAFAALAWSLWASMGLWCLLFGTDKGHISKRTGADKRTSGWPFKNSEADKKRGKKRDD